MKVARAPNSRLPHPHPVPFPPTPSHTRHTPHYVLNTQMMLKCADLGHTAAPLAQHLRWVKGLEEEMFLQVGGLVGGCACMPHRRALDQLEPGERML